MNKVYKVVWSDAANAWVAVSEISTAHGKSKSSKTIAVAVAAVGMMLSSAAVQAAGLTWGTGAVAADDEAIAMGNNSDAKTNYTIVLGSGAKNKSNGESAVVIGHGAEATSDANPNTAKNTMGQQVVVGEASVANSQSVALGAQVYATGQSSIAIGGDDLGNNDSKTSAGKYSGAQDWRNYAGQPITVEGVSTKDASNPAIGFTSTTASGRGSVAIGHMSQSTGKASLAFGADSHAEADGAIAAGMASQAKGSAAVAIGVGAEAPEAHATAIGLKAKANGGNAFAAGSNAKADGENSIALGYGASTETNSATYPRIASQPDKTMNNIAIGKTARSGGLQTIAFGAESVASKTQSIAFGFDAQATGDQSVALGANTRSTGDSSVAIGGDDLDSVASTVYRVTSPAADNDAYNDTALAKKYRELTGQNLVNFTPNNRYIGTSTGQAGVAVGVSAKAADLATAVGTKSHATGDYSAAFGVGANATLANAVALGAGSTTATNATDVPSATIGAITYGGGTSPFAGSGKVVPGDQVSIGAAGFERQIKHVAPGAITAASTDAINGSQLFYVAKGLQEQITAAGGNGIHFYHVNGANTDNNYNNDGATGSKALAAGINAKAAGASSVAVGSAEVAEKSVVGQSNSEGAVAIGDSAYAAGRQAVTLGASRAEEEQAVAIGSNARSSGKASMAIGAAAVASQENNISIGSSANTAGNNSVAIGANSSTVVAAAGSVALGHASQATRAAIDATKVQANAAPTVANNQVYALASASNVDQNNITATVKGELGAVSVGTQNATRQIINVAAGTEDSDAVNVAQLKAVANQITTQAVATTPLTVANDGKVTPPAAADAGKLATAGDIANAINSSGFKATAGGNTTGAAPTQELIKAGDTLTLKAGDGLTVEQSGSTFTYALNAQQITQNAQTPVVYTKADGSKVYKHTDGNFYDQPNGAGTQVAAGDVIASMNAGDNTTSTPTTLANVKGNLADAATATANPANNSRSDFAGKGNNAATVNDVLNAGFNVQGNGVAKDFVTHGDTINFVNGQGTVANVTSTNGVTEVKFDTPLSYADATGNNTTTPSNAVNLVGSDPSKPVTLGNVAEGVKDTDAVNVAQLNAAKTKVQAADNSPVTVTGTGSSTDPYKVGVNTVTLTAPATGTDAGKVTVPTGADAGKLVTAGDIANAINSSGFKATAGGNTTGAAPTQELIKAGDTLTLKAGDGLTVEQSGSTFTYALNAQQITQNAQTPVVYTKADGSKVYKHTDGNFYDQPNGAGTQVAAGDVIASMNAGDNTTSTPTTLANVKGNLADAATATANPANNSRSDFAGKGNNAATVNDVLNAGFNVQGNGVAKDFVTHGDTINFVNGQGTVANVTSTNGVTEVKFDTPLSYADATGNNTTTPSNAVNLVGSDPSKPVTLGNVAEGVKDTDAVNLGQLKASQTKVVAGTNIASVDHDAATNTYTVNAKGSETSGVDDETVVTATPDATTNVTSYKVGLADKVKDDIKKGVDAKDAVDNKGLTFTADNGDTGVKKLGDSVAIKGDRNIVTSADASGINMRLADVLNIGPSTGGNPVTINGNTGTIGGLTNKTWDPNSITSGQAATEDQLKLVADQAGQKGSFTLTAQGANGSTVGDGSTVDLNNTDGNIVVSKTASDNNVTFNLAKDLKADSLTINNGGPVINGNGINMGDKKITNVADGDVTATSKDAVNGSQLYAVQQEAQKRNTVKAGNNVTVTEAPNANGGTEYTINAEKSVVGGVNDETVVTATNDPTTNTTTYNVGLADKVKDDIKKGADAADAVNKKGLTFKGDSGDTGVKKLGDEVSITGDSNITTKADGNGVQVSLNRDVNVDSVKAGDSTLNNDGLTINGGPSVTKTGIDAADKKVTNVANGDVTATSKDAVNGSQLHQHGDGVKNIIGGNTTYDPNTGSYTNNDIGGTGQSTIDDAIRHINSTANAGWNLQTNGGATEKVGSGETVNFKNGNNISITNTGKEITIATNPDLTADSLTINNGGPVINGNGINMGDKKITNVADGDISDTSKDAVNGSQLHATNQNVANNTANIAKGFNFGDGNTANNYQLGDTISVKGDNNVTSTTVNGGVQLGLNQNLSLTSVTTGNTKMDNNGLTINGGPSVTTNGVDAGGKKITNVAAGEADTDAVNVGQLNQKLGAIAGANTAHVAALEQKINNVEDEADAGTASAMATAGLPQAYLPGKSMIAVGASNYRGKTGYAVGFSAITDGGNWIIKGTASGNSKGRFGASIGAGYQW